MSSSSAEDSASAEMHRGVRTPWSDNQESALTSIATVNDSQTTGATMRPSPMPPALQGGDLVVGVEPAEGYDHADVECDGNQYLQRDDDLDPVSTATAEALRIPSFASARKRVRL